MRGSVHASAIDIQMPARKSVAVAGDSGGICSGGRRPIEAVCDRVVRDFERGTRMRSLGKMYQMPVLAIEELLRERLRLLEGAMRRAGVAVACLLIGVSVAEVRE